MSAKSKLRIVNDELLHRFSFILHPFRRLACVILPCVFALVSGEVGLSQSGSQGEWLRCERLATDDFLSSVITAIEVDPHGAVWVGTDRGLAWIADDGRTWNPVDLAHMEPLPDRTAPPELSERMLINRNTVTDIHYGPSGLWVGTLDGLCLFNADQRKWELLPHEATSPAGTDPRSPNPGPQIWSVAESENEVWVSASNGVFRSRNWRRRWELLKRNFPPRIQSIMLATAAEGDACWLAGFDATPRPAGGPDILYSEDGGRAWSLQKSGTASAISDAVSVRVNRLVRIGDTLWACTRHGLAKSRNNGKSWTMTPRTSGLEADEVFDLTEAWNHLWVGTNTGLFSSSDGGKTWRRDRIVWCPVRRVVPTQRFLWLSTSGGLLRRTRGGDLQTFGVRSHVLSLAKTIEYGGETWWAGTAAGLAFSRDSGKSWRTLTVADGLPSNLILTLVGDGNRIWAGTDGGIWTSAEGGQVTRRYGAAHGLHGLRVYDLQLAQGTIYAATNRGLSVLPPRADEWRTFLPTRAWNSLCVLGDTVFGGVVDTRDPSTGMTLIRGNTTDENWEALSLPGQSGAPIHQLLVVGGEVWAASDQGLYRSRDKGDTWARFGNESLRASRITRMAAGEEHLLCVQAVPNDPPSVNRATFLNVTRDNGRSWRVLASVIPGHANAMMISGDDLVVGTRFGLSLYPAFNRDLRALRHGWLTWYRIAALAAATLRHDRLGHVSCVDRYAFHGPSVWLGSAGSGVVERGVPILDALRPTWNTTGEIPLDVTDFSMLTGEDILAAADSPRGMWFGTRTGVSFHDRFNSMRTWRPHPGSLSGAPVWAITARDETVWVGTSQGLNVLDLATMKWTTYRKGESPLPDDHVTALAHDKDKIWGGTARGAFYVERDGDWKVFLPEEKISSVALGSARKYFGSDRGIFSIDNDGEFRRQIRKGDYELRDNNVRQVFVDGPELWAATPEGVRKIFEDRAEPAVSVETEASLRGPEGVLIIVNDNSPDSIAVGEKYRELRNIPPENICHVLGPETDTIDRRTYERYIRDRVWRHLRETGLSRKVSFLVTTYGVPLRIRPTPEQPRRPGTHNPAVSVDSELTLVGRLHPETGLITNPYLHREEPFDSTRFGMYLVTRLDGPTPEAALSLATRAVETEETRAFGAHGFARFDVYPADTGDGKDTESTRRLNAAVESNFQDLRRQTRLHGRVTVPERTLQSYFRPGSCFNTFFYLGWGPREYRAKVFTWAPGAVGVSLDPLTAPSLRDTEHSWVAAAVNAGITATVGSVDDPKGRSALSPSGLYRYLHAGFTWAEAAYMSTPHLSSQMVVIGDPLYAPMK